MQSGEFGKSAGKAFRCLTCGLDMDVDVNAAINLVNFFADKRKSQRVE